MKNTTLFIEQINYKITELERVQDYKEIRRYKRILLILWDNLK